MPILKGKARVQATLGKGQLKITIGRRRKSLKKEVGKASFHLVPIARRPTTLKSFVGSDQE